MPPRVSIIILNWNKPDLTIACYRSCLAQTFCDREILIVDNASTDNSLPRFTAECRDARILRNVRNEGTGGGFAFGARHAQGDFLLFLCNDTELDPDVLAKLMEVMDAHPDCGVCGCTHVWHKDPTTIELQGYRVDRFGVQHCFGAGWRWTGEDRILSAWCSGTVLLTRRDAYEKAGGYDPLHFTLNDEVDLCWRIRIHGYRLLIRTGARVVHRHFATLSNEKRPQTRYWAERHLLRTLLKNYSAGYLARILPLYSALLLMEILFLCLLGHFAVAAADLRAIGWNIRLFPDIRRHRQRIQRTRTVPDAVFVSECWPGSVKLQWALWLLRHRRPLYGAAKPEAPAPP